MDRFDVIVIGGGSGGLAAGRRAAALGKRVALIEYDRLGGTCVNRGCVPKKLFHDTAAMLEAMHDSHAVGFEGSTPTIQWSLLRDRIHGYIDMLNGVYARNLDRDAVTHVIGKAQFTGPNTVRVGDRDLHGDVIVIATGTRPKPPPIEGGDLALVSDDFFQLADPPRRVLVIGGGYIGMEFAGILSTFGSKVTVVEFLDRVLAPFDEDVSKHVHELYEKLGIEVHVRSAVKRIEDVDGARRVTVQSRDGGEAFQGTYDAVISAVGRVPNVEALNLDQAGVTVNALGFIAVNDEERTSVPHIYAVGDVTGRPALTPVAIKAGRRLADRLFAGGTERMNYDVVPTAVFTPVEIGVVGLTEAAARERYGDDAVKVYRSEFKPMRKALVKDTPVRALVKMVVAGAEEKVVGLHLVGPEAAEIIQGFAVAVTAGLTKKQFDDTIAIHPSLAEEVVTLR
jgi:glutathione reductase (NADPH)